MSTTLASTYGWQSEEEEESHAYLLPPVIKKLSESCVKRVIDVGTGNGATLPVWLSQGYEVAAMEPDEDGFLYSKKHTGVDLRQLGVGEAVPAEWESAFDALISLEVVEHLFDPSQLAETAFSLLREDGIAIISTPYHGYIKNLALALFDKWDFHHHPLRVGGHIKFWSHDSLKKLFEKSGFEFVSFQGAGRFPYLWKSMIMVFRKK